MVGNGENARYYNSLGQRFEQAVGVFQGHGPRQIDYASIDVTAAGYVEDAEACDDITTGMDHRSVKVTLLLPCDKTLTTRTRTTTQVTSAVNWKPRDEKEYQYKSEHKLGDIGTGSADWLQHALADKCADVERVLKDIALECRKEEDMARARKEKLSIRAKRLIAERRQAR